MATTTAYRPARARRKGQFATAAEGRARAIKVYMCRVCETFYDGAIPSAGLCRKCNAHRDFETFDSRIEARFASELFFLRRARRISDLEFHPVLRCNVPAVEPYRGGRDYVLKYTPDGRYWDIERQVWTIYDVKAKGAPLGERFRLVSRIFATVLGCPITIIYR